MSKFLIGGAASAILLGGMAVAQTAQPGPAPRPASHARHAPPTRAEVQARVAAEFAKLDANHDGFITKDELDAAAAARHQKAEARAARFDPSKMFDRLDTNHDGQITAAELDAAHAGHVRGSKGLLAHADANKDGIVTRAEFDAVGARLKARMEHASASRGGIAGRMFEQADTDKDGRVSLAEMQQAALARFDRADLNHDGTISPDERQQERALFRSQHHRAQAPAKP
jgi:Ca2+-binding EF-hand superfamily protein